MESKKKLRALPGFIRQTNMGNRLALRGKWTRVIGAREKTGWEGLVSSMTGPEEVGILLELQDQII